MDCNPEVSNIFNIDGTLRDTGLRIMINILKTRIYCKHNKNALYQVNPFYFLNPLVLFLLSCFNLFYIFLTFCFQKAACWTHFLISNGINGEISFACFLWCEYNLFCVSLCLSILMRSMCLERLWLPLMGWTGCGYL